MKRMPAKQTSSLPLLVSLTSRYVGDNYSKALEAMEEAMRSFYSQSSAHIPLSNPSMGQLAAVQGEDGEDLTRAQIVAVLPFDKVMVRVNNWLPKAYPYNRIKPAMDGPRRTRTFPLRKHIL